MRARETVMNILLENFTRLAYNVIDDSVGYTYPHKDYKVG